MEQLLLTEAKNDDYVSLTHTVVLDKDFCVTSVCKVYIVLVDVAVYRGEGGWEGEIVDHHKLRP